MPAIRLSSVAGIGLLTRGAWRSMDASRAFAAIRDSNADGVASALVGIRPNWAMTSAATNSRTAATIIPRTRPRMVPPPEPSPHLTIKLHCIVVEPFVGRARLPAVPLQHCNFGLEPPKAEPQGLKPKSHKSFSARLEAVPSRILS